jgi:hypothetical protein
MRRGPSRPRLMFYVSPGALPDERPRTFLSAFYATVLAELRSAYSSFSICMRPMMMWLSLVSSEIAMMRSITVESPSSFA